MKTKWWLPLVLLLIAVMALGALAGCKHTIDPDDTDPDAAGAVAVAEGVQTVFEAMERSCKLEGNVDQFYIAFSCRLPQEGRNDKLIDFAALLDISPANIEQDANSRLALTVRTDLDTVSSLEVYYTGGVLYVNYPPVINRAKIDGVTLSTLAAALRTSYLDGDVHRVSQLLPTIANAIFDDCTRSVEGDTHIYTFRLNYAMLWQSLDNIAQQIGLGLTRADLAALLGVDASAATQADSRTTVSFAVQQVRSAGYFRSAALHLGDTQAIAMTDWQATVVTDNNRAQCTVAALDSVNTGVFHRYDPFTVSVAGDLVLHLDSASTQTQSILGLPVMPSMTKADVTWHYTLQTNRAADGAYTALATLQTADDERSVCLYLQDNVLYADLSAYGLGQWKFTAEQLQSALTALGASIDYVAPTGQQTATALLDAICDRTKDADSVHYRLSAATIDLLRGWLQQTVWQQNVHTGALLDVKSMEITLDTRNNAFRGLRLALDVWGNQVEIVADDPVIGAEQIIACPAWTAQCIDVAAQTALSVQWSGSIRSGSNYGGNTALLQGLVYSLTGDTIDLSGVIDRYRTTLSYNPVEGRPTAFQVDLLQADDSLVCTLYYYAEQADRLYVMYPVTADGITPVTSHYLVADNRYTEWLRGINGNHSVTAGSPCTLANTTDGWTVTWDRQGANAWLNKLHELWPAGLIDSIPLDMGTQAIRLSVGESTWLRTTFGGGRYIELGIDDMTFGDNANLLQATALPDAEISLWSNSEGVMPACVDVTLGNEAGHAMRVAIDDWTYDHIPQSGDGGGNRVVVVATAYVLGQPVQMALRTDCSVPQSTTIVNNYQYADYRQGDDFIFDRYNSVADPLVVLQSFGTANVTVVDRTIAKTVTWLHNGADIAVADWDTAQQDTFTIVPTVRSFFGTTLTLAGDYRVVLQGSRIASVQDAADYLTIAAYRTDAPYDPFDPATYQVKDPAFVCADGTTVHVRTIAWQTDTIASAGTLRDSVAALSGQEALDALASHLYDLSGTYTLTLAVQDSLHRTAAFAVTVSVEPRRLGSVSFAAEDLMTGIQYNADDKTFVIQPLTLDAIDRTTTFASAVLCELGQSTVRLTTVNWIIAAVDNIPVLQGAQGAASLTIGNDIGGLQTARLQYRIPALAADGIALTDSDGRVIDGTVTAVEDTAVSQYAFSLLDLDPYRYAKPCGVALLQQQAVLATLSWTSPFDGWDDGQLWYSERTYTSQMNRFGLQLSIEISFVPKIVQSWTLVPDAQDVVAAAPVFVPAENGDWVVVNRVHVPYDAHDPVHEGLPRYTRTDDTYLVQYRKVREGDNDVKRMIIDPNLVDFHCLDAYPATALVTFRDGTQAQLPLLWDLSALDAIGAADGYRGNITASLPLGQRLVGEVGLWIASATPQHAYVRVEYDTAIDPETGEEIQVVRQELVDGAWHTVGYDTLDMQLLQWVHSLDGDMLQRNDLLSTRYIHSLLCGCDQADCLGRLYFEYAEGDNVQNGWFAITEWQGLDNITKLYQTQMQQGVAIQDVAGTVTVTAKVQDVACSIKLNIRPSTLTDLRLTGIPLASSSLGQTGTSGYSMRADGMNLTIDPYLADPKAAGDYPTKLQFVLRGETCIVSIDDWNLDELQTMTPYLGGTATGYALLYTEMGTVTLAAPITVQPRVIAGVYDMNGVALGNKLIINSYDTAPFGESVRYADGRTYACKLVKVRFAQDDSLYPMLLQYDITDLTASYSGGLLAADVTVLVGNDAGGYQAQAGYSLYAQVNTVVRVVCDLPAVTAYIPDGVLYDLGAVSGHPFASFDDSAAAMAAWRALTVDCRSLTVTLGVPGGATTQYTATLEAIEGLGFRWLRDEDACMHLVIDGRNELYLAHIDNCQDINTACRQRIALQPEMLVLGDIASGLTATYNANTTIADIMAEHPVYATGQELFSDSDIVWQWFAAADSDYAQPLAKDSVPDAGDYNLRIGVSNVQYGGSIVLPVIIRPATIDTITVRDGNALLSLDDLQTKGFHTQYSGFALALSAQYVDQNGNTTRLQLQYYNAEGTLLDEAPIEVGVYTLRIVCQDSNYSVTVGDIAVEIFAAQ